MEKILVKKVFAIYDCKMAIYRFVFMALEKGEALRHFMDAVNDKNTDLAKHPEDFTLFYLADFDEVTGKYNQLVANESLGTGIEFLKKD